MKELGITMIVLGLAAHLGSLFAPVDWQLERWGMALLMLGAPLMMLQVWIEQRRDRLNSRMPDDHVPPPEQNG